MSLILLCSIVILLYQYEHKTKLLSHAKIDQLVMQASYGQDQKSMQQLERAAENSNIEGQLALGKVYLFRRQDINAIKWLSIAAQKGSTEAATALGKLYLKGGNDVVQNYSLARQWFYAAYLKHDPTAAYYLGLMYKNGYGTQVQLEQAFQCFKLAAEHQIPNAMFMLANAYQFGEGVSIDLKQALHWYQSAADMELPEAIQELAHLYQYGNAAVKADPVAYQHQLLEIGHALKHPAINP